MVGVIIEYEGASVVVERALMVCEIGVGVAVGRCFG